MARFRAILCHRSPAKSRKLLADLRSAASFSGSGLALAAANSLPDRWPISPLFDGNRSHQAAASCAPRPSRWPSPRPSSSAFLRTTGATAGPVCVLRNDVLMEVRCRQRGRRGPRACHPSRPPEYLGPASSISPAQRVSPRPLHSLPGQAQVPRRHAVGFGSITRLAPALLSARPRRGKPGLLLCLGISLRARTRRRSLRRRRRIFPWERHGAGVRRSVEVHSLYGTPGCPT